MSPYYYGGYYGYGGGRGFRGRGKLMFLKNWILRKRIFLKVVAVVDVVEDASGNEVNLIFNLDL